MFHLMIEGLIPEVDAKRLLEFGSEIKRRFSNPLGRISGSGNEVVLELEKETSIDHILLMEDIALGERVRKFEIDAYVDGKWVSIATGTAIGHKFIKQVSPVKTRELKLKILETVENPIIKEFSCYYSEK